MKKVDLLKKDNDENWAKHFVDDSNYDKLWDEDVIVRKPNGQLLFILLKNAIPKEINTMAWSVLKKYNAVTENRGTASGISSAPRKKKDGTYSKVTRVPKGWEVISGIIGYYERTVRTPYCHACAWNAQHPKEYGVLQPLIKKVDELYKLHAPERYAIQKKFVDNTPPEFVIGDSVFTTLTINKNFRTACHKDVGDLPEGFSCMSVIREGRYLGGNLVFPNYRHAVKLDTGDLILFDPHEFHGNTQIVPLSKEYTRCSIVYYYREKVQFCLPIEDEIERAKKRKEGDPLYD